MINKQTYHKYYLGFLIVLILSVIPLFDLLHPGLPVTHDGMDHVARIANFYKSLSEGNIIPRWAANLNWGYGHPILMFLYPFSSYLASFFHFLSFSFIDSAKIVFALGFIASGITIYMWAREQFNEYAGIAAAVLYLYAPYRFIDLYVRGDIGENMAFVFLPLILFFLFRFFKKNTLIKDYLYFVGTSVSVALLLLSHNAISIIFLPVAFVYAIYLSFSSKQIKKLLFAFISFGMGFFLAGFFIIPAFFEGKFTLRDIVIGDEYKTRFINPLDLLYGPWSYGISGQFSIQLGIIQLLGLILFPFAFFRLKKQKSLRIWFALVFVFFLVSIFLMMQQSQFVYQILTILKKFQFPWRFLSLSVFTLAVLGLPIFLILKKGSHKKIILVFVIILAFATTFSYWKAKSYIIKPDSFFSGVYHGTTDTGESAPIWSVRFMEQEPKAHFEIIDGQAKFKEILRTTTIHEYAVSVLSAKTRFKDNTLYFPAWTVYANNKIIPIQFQDPSERGLITFYLDKGDYLVDVVFKDTKLRVLSDYVSAVSAIFLLGFGLYIFTKAKNEK